MFLQFNCVACTCVVGTVSRVRCPRWLGAVCLALFCFAQVGVAEDAAPAVAKNTPAAARVEYLPQPSPAEQRILAALDEPTTIPFAETPLNEARDYLQDLHHIQIYLKHKALDDAGVSGETTLITFATKGKDVTLGSALRLMLDEFELTYVVDDGFLRITTKDDAGTLTTTRVYPVGDLADQEDDDEDEDYDSLVDTITSTVRPSTWDEVGGPGNMSVVRNAKSLVIDQTDETHREILTLLRSLRAAKAVASNPTTAK